jgi:aconitate hydratase
MIVGPDTPDLARPISAFAAEVRGEGLARAADLRTHRLGARTRRTKTSRARADVASQVFRAGGKLSVPIMVSPGSEQIRATIERDGLLGTLEKAGATVLANACGPCIGQWKRDDIAPGTPNAIITSFNRNFKGRNDGNEATKTFIASPRS